MRCHGERSRTILGRLSRNPSTPLRVTIAHRLNVCNLSDDLKRRFSICNVLILAVIGLFFQSCTYYFGNSRVRKFNTEEYSLPDFKSRPDKLPFDERIKLNPELVEEWANKTLDDWQHEGKVSEPRMMIAKLALGKEVEAVNNYIRTLKPWGKVGTDWFMNPKGDYDFTEITLCALVYLFKDQPDKLFPETAEYIMKNLITSDGYKPKPRAPHSIHIMKDTENHILMKEISRYLKNQWLTSHSCEVNVSAMFEHEDWLSDFLDEMEKTGMYEFNSDPYFGYTMVPLLVLEAFASEKLSTKTRQVIDVLNWEYALGSLNFRFSGPFRRRLERAGRTQLDADPRSSMMKTLTGVHSKHKMDLDEIGHARHQALMALLLSYQLPDTIVNFMKARPEYFARIGHGFRASPEIFSAGKDFLLSAGGVQRGKRSQIVAKPIALLLDDGIALLDSCFHLKGKGKMKKWNHTGVYKNFAVINGNVRIPEQYKPEIADENWMIFKPYPERNFRITIHKAKDLGLLMVFPNWKKSSLELTQEIQAANPSAEKLNEQVVFPGGPTIEYDVKAKKRLWVVKSVNGKAVDRKHDFWKRLQVIQE